MMFYVLINQFIDNKLRNLPTMRKKQSKRMKKKQKKITRLPIDVVVVLLVFILVQNLWPAAQSIEPKKRKTQLGNWENCAAACRFCWCAIFTHSARHNKAQWVRRTLAYHANGKERIDKLTVNQSAKRSVCLPPATLFTDAINVGAMKTDRPRSEA